MQIGLIYIRCCGSQAKSQNGKEEAGDKCKKRVGMAFERGIKNGGREVNRKSVIRTAIQVTQVHSRSRLCSLSRRAIGLEGSLQYGGARVDNAQQKTIDVVLEVRYLVITILEQTDETLRIVDNFNE